jgi:hypothetical protein
VNHLIRQVMALANSDSGDSRCLVFGAEQGRWHGRGDRSMRITDVARLTAQLQLCSDVIEPLLRRAVIAVVAGKPWRHWSSTVGQILPTSRSCVARGSARG